MRIGTKKLSFDIYIAGKNKWHTGIATLCIWKEHWVEEENDWGSNWWIFIPILGKRKKN